jgi:hypothetical protein
MRQLLICCLLGVATAVGAVTIDGTVTGQGTLASAQAATGASANEIDFGLNSNRRGAIFQMRNTAGTATVGIEVNCLPGTADWALLPGSSNSLTVSTAALTVTYPGCRYRANVTACTTCSVTVTVTGLRPI